MNASRELDKLIAEKIMGWTELEFKNPQYAGSVELYGAKPGERASPYTGAKAKYVVPKYSTDISAAWEVVEKLKWAEPEISWSDEQHCWHAMFRKGRSSGVSSGADTAPLAICLAALKTHGIEVKE